MVRYLCELRYMAKLVLDLLVVQFLLVLRHWKFLSTIHVLERREIGTREKEKKR